MGSSETEVIGRTAATATNILFSLNHSKILALPNYTTGDSPFLNYNTKLGAAYAALNNEFVLGGDYFWGGASGLVGDPDNATGSGGQHL